jgi:hypothetical protein
VASRHGTSFAGAAGVAEVGGLGSVKEGMNYAHALREALERVVALRLHLDDSNENNGPLRVLPGTHQSGVLTDEEVLRLAEKISGVECLVAQGGVVIMRPRDTRVVESYKQRPRRVLHIEYASTEEIAKDWRRSPREKSRFLAALGMTCFIMVRECRVLRG